MKQETPIEELVTSAVDSTEIPMEEVEDYEQVAGITVHNINGWLQSMGLKGTEKEPTALFGFGVRAMPKRFGSKLEPADLKCTVRIEYAGGTTATVLLQEEDKWEVVQIDFVFYSKLMKAFADLTLKDKLLKALLSCTKDNYQTVAATISAKIFAAIQIRQKPAA